MTARHLIPTAALDDRLGFVGNAGGGKTYSAGTAVERLLAAKARVVIPDPFRVIRERHDGEFSHIVEPSGMRQAASDAATKGTG